MLLNLCVNKTFDKSLLFVLDKLPKNLKERITDFLNTHQLYTVNEIRIHLFSNVILLINEKTINTKIHISKNEIDNVFLSLCDGSVYSHIDTIKDGYIRVGKGIRAGICGRAVRSAWEISGVYEISSIVIRIPQRIKFAGEYVYNFLKESNFTSSFLLYSSPGVGKTTILRDLVYRLSKEKALRVAVIDTKEEIIPFLEEGLAVNAYLSYPKGIGIELATKNMAPHIIICDEITSVEEALSIKRAVSSGVTFVATTHARSIEELKRKEIAQTFFNDFIFEFAIGIKRNNKNKFEYSLDKLI